MTKLESTLDNLKQQGRKALNIYITAGAPDFNTSRQAILEVINAGADIVEIGIPFSDPLADGPVIQSAAIAALNHSMSPYRVVSLIKDLRRVTSAPLIGMGYINSLMSYGYKYGNDYNGFERFVTEAKIAGLDGLIIADVPHEESESMKTICQRKRVHLIDFVTPLTAPERMQDICANSSGFIYCVSSLGVTGVKNLDYSQINEVVTTVKGITNTPVMVGFGIGSPEAAVAAAESADGVIVGSAVVKRLMAGEFNEAVELVKSIRTALDKAY